MKSKLMSNRAAVLAATVFLAACGTEGSSVAAVAPVAPGLELAEADAAPEVLYPSDLVYRGDVQATEAGSFSIAASSAMPLVRVAVTDSANFVRMFSGSGRVFLGATGAWTMTDRSNGVTLLKGNGNLVEVKLAAEPETNYRGQVVCGRRDVVEAWKAAAEALGHPTFLETIPACTRLLIGKLSKTASWTERVTYANLLVSQGLAPGGVWWRHISLPASYRVVNGLEDIVSLNPVQVQAAAGGHVTIGTSSTHFRRYRGVAYATVTGKGTLAGVNELPMEQYIYGVVPRELGPIAYPEYEAQKAQAVAARTFALRGLGRRGSDGYDLRSTTADQVYGGLQDEHPISTSAINETAGLVAHYNGTLIETLYSSASGGHTASNEEVFDSKPVAYLRGVPDAERGSAFAHVPTLEIFRAHANPTSLRNAAENLFESDWSSRERWTFTWTASEISSIIAEFARRPVGRVHALNVSSRGPSGRALVIEYVTDSGTFTDTKDRIRSSLRYITASGARTNMPSTLIFIEPVREEGELTGRFRVYGGGFGHGIGMSQTGAVGMAQKGRTYQEILRHYYQGIDLVHGY